MHIQLVGIPKSNSQHGIIGKRIICSAFAPAHIDIFDVGGSEENVRSLFLILCKLKNVLVRHYPLISLRSRTNNIRTTAEHYPNNALLKFSFQELANFPP